MAKKPNNADKSAKKNIVTYNFNGEEFEAELGLHEQEFETIEEFEAYRRAIHVMANKPN